MSVRLADGAIRLEGACAVEDAATLLSALQAQPGAPVDLTACGALHLAVAQVLMAARVSIRGTPSDPFVQNYLLPNFRSLPD